MLCSACFTPLIPNGTWVCLGVFISINLCVVHTESKDVTQLLKLLQVKISYEEYGEKTMETSGHHWGFFVEIWPDVFSSFVLPYREYSRLV